MVKRLMALLAALTLVLALGACSDTESDSSGSAKDAEESSAPALEGTEVSVDHISAVVPDGWVEGGDRTYDINDIWVDQVVDEGVTPMVWQFRVDEAWMSDAEAAANHALNDFEGDVERGGGTDVGTVTVDGVEFYKAETAEGWFNYYGQTEPDDENNYLLIRFSLSAKPDGTVDEEVANELLKGVQLDL